MGVIAPRVCPTCFTEWRVSEEGTTCPHCASRLDFNSFFERVTTYLLCQRLQIVFDIARDERFAAQVFGAHSATMRLKRIAQVLALRVIEDRPAIEVVH